jgi:hypothetical protein
MIDLLMLTTIDDDDDDEDKEIRAENTNGGEQIGRQISQVTTEVLDRMTVIDCRAGEVEDSEGTVMPALMHNQDTDVNDAQAKKVVGRRAPRGQIQYSEDEMIEIESGRFDMAVEECVSRKKDHRGKSLVEGESDDLKFERCGTGGRISYLDEDDDAEESSSSEDTEGDSSASSGDAELQSFDSFVTEAEQNSIVNYEEKARCFMYSEDYS